MGGLLSGGRSRGRRCRRAGRSPRRGRWRRGRRRTGPARRARVSSENPASRTSSNVLMPRSSTSPTTGWVTRSVPSTEATSVASNPSPRASTVVSLARIRSAASWTGSGAPSCSRGSPPMPPSSSTSLGHDAREDGVEGDADRQVVEVRADDAGLTANDELGAHPVAQRPEELEVGHRQQPPDLEGGGIADVLAPVRADPPSLIGHVVRLTRRRAGDLRRGEWAAVPGPADVAAPVGVLDRHVPGGADRHDAGPWVVDRRRAEQPDVEVVHVAGEVTRLLRARELPVRQHREARRDEQRLVEAPSPCRPPTSRCRGARGAMT